MLYVKKLNCYLKSILLEELNKIQKFDTINKFLEVNVFWNLVYQFIILSKLKCPVKKLKFTGVAS